MASRGRAGSVDAAEAGGGGGGDELRQNLLNNGEYDYQQLREQQLRDQQLRQQRDAGSETDESDDSDSDANLLQFTPFSRSPMLFFKKRFKAGSVKGSVFTLVVAIAGAGTLSVPYAIERSGLLLGLGFFVIGALMAFFSLRLLIISSELTGVKSYKGISEHLFGHRTSVFAQVMLLLNLYGTSISYIVASGTMVAKVLQTVALDPHDEVPYVLRGKFVMIVTTCAFVVPLSLLRTMGALRYSSLIGVFCSCYLAVVVVVTYFSFCTHHATVLDADGYEQTVECFWEKDVEGAEPLALAHWDLSRMLSSIPIVVYSYTCHPNVLPIFLELQKPTRRRMYKVVGRAIALAFSLYAVLGAFAYMTFKSQLAHSAGNFLNNDYHKNASTLLGAIGMSLSVILAIPLFVHAFRGNVFSLFGSDDLDPKTAPLSLHAGVSLGMVGLALLPAVLISDISAVFAVLGSTTNPLICFVLPSMFICKCAPAGMYTAEKWLSVVIAVVISAISLASLSESIKGWFA